MTTSNKSKKTISPSPPVKKTEKATKPAPVKAAEVKTSAAKPVDVKKPSVVPDEILFVREYWTGDSRDGVLVNGDGYHFFRMTKPGKIVEAYECYELDDGRECVTPCPDMISVHWIDDLGYEDFEILDVVHELEFIRIKNIANGIDPS